MQMAPRMYGRMDKKALTSLYQVEDLPLAEDLDVVRCAVPNPLDEDHDDVDARPGVAHEEERWHDDGRLRIIIQRLGSS